jgi:hypothetical protein
MAGRDVLVGWMVEEYYTGYTLSLVADTARRDYPWSGYTWIFDRHPNAETRSRRCVSFESQMSEGRLMDPFSRFVEFNAGRMIGKSDVGSSQNSCCGVSGLSLPLPTTVSKYSSSGSNIATRNVGHEGGLCSTCHTWERACPSGSCMATSQSGYPPRQARK